MSQWVGLLGTLFFLILGIGVIAWCMLFGADDDTSA